MDYLPHLEAEKSHAKDLLSCLLCAQTYDDPRSLPCHHTFCRRCLQRYCDVRQSEASVRIGSFPCPSCQTLIGLPHDGAFGFPVDHKIQHIKELVINQMAEKISKNVRAMRSQTSSDADGSSSVSDAKESHDSHLLNGSFEHVEEDDDNFAPDNDYLSYLKRMPLAAGSRQRFAYSSLRETRRRATPDFRQAFESNGFTRAKSAVNTFVDPGSPKSTLRCQSAKCTRTNTEQQMFNGSNGTSNGHTDAKPGDTGESASPTGSLRRSSGYSSLREKHRRSYADLVSFYEDASKCLQEDNKDDTRPEQLEFRGNRERMYRSDKYRSETNLMSSHINTQSPQMYSCTSERHLPQQPTNESTPQKPTNELDSQFYPMRTSACSRSLPEQPPTSEIPPPTAGLDSQFPPAHSSTSRRYLPQILTDKNTPQKPASDSPPGGQVNGNIGKTSAQVTSPRSNPSPTDLGVSSFSRLTKFRQVSLAKRSTSSTSSSSPPLSPPKECHLINGKSVDESDQGNCPKEDYNQNRFFPNKMNNKKIPKSRNRPTISLNTFVNSTQNGVTTEVKSAGVTTTVCSRPEGLNADVAVKVQLDEHDDDLLAEVDSICDDLLNIESDIVEQSSSAKTRTETFETFGSRVNPARRAADVSTVDVSRSSHHRQSSSAQEQRSSSAADTHAGGGLDGVHGILGAKQSIVDSARTPFAVSNNNMQESSSLGKQSNQEACQVASAAAAPRSVDIGRVQSAAAYTAAYADVQHDAGGASSRATYNSEAITANSSCSVPDGETVTSSLGYVKTSSGRTSGTRPFSDCSHDINEDIGAGNKTSCRSSGGGRSDEPRSTDVADHHDAEKSGSSSSGNKTTPPIVDSAPVRNVPTKKMSDVDWSDCDSIPAAETIELRVEEDSDVFERSKVGDDIEMDGSLKNRNEHIDNEMNGGLQGDSKHVEVLLQQESKQEYVMPTGVAMLSRGATVVADYGVGSLQYYDDDGSFCHKIDGLKPFSIATNVAGDRLIVGDRKRRTVCVFDDYGADVAQWDANQFNWICGIGVLRNDDLAILDRERSNIGIYKSSGELVAQFGSYGTNDAQLCMGEFLAVDGRDRIITCDSANHCVKIFDQRGALVRKFGERGAADGQMQWPKGICTDARGNVILADTCNGRVSMFTGDGQFVQHLVTGVHNPYAVSYRSPNILAVTMYSLNGLSKFHIYTVAH